MPLRLPRKKRRSKKRPYLAWLFILGLVGANLITLLILWSLIGGWWPTREYNQQPEVLPPLFLLPEPTLSPQPTASATPVTTYHPTATVTSILPPTTTSIPSTITLRPATPPPMITEGASP